MVAKLIRHEFRATTRSMIFLYAAAVVIALLEFAGFRLNQPVLGVISMMALYLITTVLVVMTIVLIVKRFSSNLFGYEGYLMQSLPVKTSALVFSKLCVAMVWLVLCMVFAVGAQIFVLFSIDTVDNMSAINIVNQAFEEQGMPPVAAFVNMMPLIAVMELIGLLFFVVLIYFSIAVANTGRFQNHSTLVGFAVFILTNVVYVILDLVVGTLVPIGVAVNADGMNFTAKGTDVGMMLEGKLQIGLAPIPLELLCIFFFLWATWRIMDRHLSIK